MILYIRNMVCSRCIMVVRQELEKQGLHPDRVVLGEVTLQEQELSAAQLAKVDESLEAVGFERIDDRKARLIESIKKTVIQFIRDEEGKDRRMTWSHLLSEALHYDYNYLSSLFSSVEGITLEQYIILQKIERVKELIAYDELSLKEITARLNYSSVAHLSNQFKKVTGFTPTEFKSLRSEIRKPLDKV